MSMGEKYHNVIGISGEKFVPESSDYYSDFKVHPNDTGFDFYSKALISALKNYL